MQNSGSKNMKSPIPYRIRIGVTGHRELPRPDAISSLVSQALDKKLHGLFDDASRDALRRVWRTPLLLSVVSPLAEGADRVVAHEVLKRHGATLEAVLPLVVNDYVEDFATEQSRREFVDLLEKCRHPRVLRHRRLDQDFSAEHVGDARRHAYADVGRFVVDQCDVLIALWDGHPARGVGGTAEVVAYARYHGHPVIRVWIDDAETIEVFKGYGLRATSILGIEAFNSLNVVNKTEREYIANLEKDHFGKPSSLSIPESTKESIRNVLFPSYVRASLIAKRNQALYRRAGTYGYLLSAAAVASVAIGVLFPILATWAFAFELSILTTVLIVVGITHQAKSAEKWIESRFLTERLRAAIYMAACGVEVAPIQLPPYMGETEQPDDWMVRIFQDVWGQMPRMQGCAAHNCELLGKYIADQWIQGQISFHEAKAKREGRQNQQLYRYGRLLFLTTMLAAICHLLPEHLFGSSGAWQALAKPLTFTAIVFPALAAALTGLRSHREHLRLEKRSMNMVPRLSYLMDRISRVTNSLVFERVLRETEATMLQEAQDWLMLMRMVTIEPT
jgi:hypothetical protein